MPNSFQKSANLPCPLCVSTDLAVTQNQHRVGIVYWHCQNCDLIFVDPFFLPTPEAEKARYQAHQNSEADLGYLKFLQPMVDLVRANFVPGPELRFLDYGSGPEPLLLKLLKQQGFQGWGDDPYFSPDRQPLSATYDFVVATEVVEHFHHPGREFKFLVTLLRPGGQLLLMTQLHQGEEHFASWWYAKDLTHVSFFSQKSFHWLSRELGLELTCDGHSLLTLTSARL